ncbi:archaemetzincin family Zn-dependent metalloprotease [Carboxylicivirga caseinilyticus]|uniref:archaemetzincin family Zn-dependent metalloprotease n=1 Tax=Carboxylicivirga caseinilyticus TaxID=3417572 RepID=UPI003D33E5C4|nr:archaemetzincin family Zn-dependent metalloprotease [Marinilabiliaceae bacterium A049]
MNPCKITLISFGQIEKPNLEIIARDVKRELQVQVEYKEGFIDMSQFFDPSRSQYDADQLIHLIDTEYASDTTKTIGLFTVDLFIEILTFIYGQAFLNGRSGIASSFRLNNERYGMNRNDRLTLKRFSKEIIHELGHTFGLIHCHTPGCVMMSSTYVEDIDLKSHQFCSNCKNELEMIFINNVKF